MIQVPLYHLSPVGRAAIDVESARIRQALAARRAERQSRPQALHGPEGVERSTAPARAGAEAVDQPTEAVALRP